MTDKNKKKYILFNKKINYNYFIVDKYEAGIKLTGTEVKSIRNGLINIQDSFIKINSKGNAILYNSYIHEYVFGNKNNHDPKRSRELLLTKHELIALKNAQNIKNLSIIPLSIFFLNQLVKVEIVTAKGKKMFDKREFLRIKSINNENKNLKY